MTASNPSATLRGIYGITDDVLTPDDQLLNKVEAALAGGVRLLQYRCKLKDAELRKAQAAALLALCQRHQATLIINDDVQLCSDIGAHGVHLGVSDRDLSDARAMLGNEKIVGVTCHDSLQRAREAEAGGADYVAFGRFFPSHTKPDAPPADIALLSRAKQEIGLPIVAIGGINPENGASLVEAGADMLAVVHSLFAGDDIQENAKQLIGLFQSGQGFN